MNSLYNSNSVTVSKIAYFRAKYCHNFTTPTSSTILSSIRVTEQKGSINNLFPFLSTRSDLSFLEGFNHAKIIEIIVYVSMS